MVFFVLIEAFIYDQTIPIQISTRSATITTSAEIVKPWIIGLVPDFFMLENDVLSPIAAKAHTIRNLLVRLVRDTTDAGTVNILATIAIPKNPRINQGNILVNLKFIFTSEEPPLARHSLVLMRN